MENTAKARVVITVEGIVQGVGFRYFIHRNARRLGLTGTVQNLPGSKVYIVAEGNKSDLQDLLALAKEGPGGAWVKNYSVDWEQFTGLYNEFSITH